MLILKPECSKCKNPSKNPISFRGSPDADIMIVGRNPSKTEVLTHLPFTGQAGYVLNQILRGCKLSSNDVYITNLVKCPTPGDARPLTEVCNLCASLFLEEEIRKVDPSLIISLGEECLNFFGHKQHIMEWRGYACEWEGRKVLFSLHPAFIKRGNPEFLEIMFADFQKALRLLKEDIPDEDYETIINPSSEEIGTYMQKWKNGFTFDIETGPWEVALNPRLGNIKSIACCGDNSRAFSAEWKEPYISILAAMLNNPLIPKIAQNAPFDMGFLKCKGVEVKGLVYDTSLGSHTICSDLPKKLSFQRSIYTNIPPYKDKTRGKQREVTQTQGCMDALVTFISWKEQLKCLKEDPELEKFYFDFFLPKLNMILNLNLQGVCINKNVLIEQTARILKPRKALQEYFVNLGINPNSPSQIGDYAFRKMKIPLHDFTPTGRVQVSEGIMTKVLRHCDAPQREFVQHFLDWQNVNYTFTHYLKGIYDRLEDNKIFTNYNISVSPNKSKESSAPATGRLASENPNLQNVPVPYRRFFIPPPGQVFIGVDYKQLELTVAALLAGDQSLLDLLISGKDVHDEIAVLLFNIPPGSATHDQRILAKRIVFGTLYGASPHAFVRDYELNPKGLISTDTFRLWQNKCMGKFPALITWRENIKTEAQQNGKLRNVYGRVRFFFEDKVTTKAYNFPVQSASSDMVLENMHYLFDLGYTLNLPVHDFFAIQTDEDKAEKTQAEISEILKRPNSKFGGWSFLFKTKVGRNWEEVS